MAPVRTWPLTKMRGRGERALEARSLRSDSSSSVRVEIRNQQCDHASQYRIRYLVQLSNADPLRCITKFGCCDSKQIIAGNSDCSHVSCSHWHDWSQRDGRRHLRG